ncbi:hypothetical protein FKM82_022314 [Ascaphus truei]
MVSLYTEKKKRKTQDKAITPPSLLRLLSLSFASRSCVCFIPLTPPPPLCSNSATKWRRLRRAGKGGRRQRARVGRDVIRA